MIVYRDDADAGRVCEALFDAGAGCGGNRSEAARVLDAIVAAVGEAQTPAARLLRLAAHAALARRYMDSGNADQALSALRSARLLEDGDPPPFVATVDAAFAQGSVLTEALAQGGRRRFLVVYVDALLAAPAILDAAGDAAGANRAVAHCTAAAPVYAAGNRELLYTAAILPAQRMSDRDVACMSTADRERVDRSLVDMMNVLDNDNDSACAALHCKVLAARGRWLLLQSQFEQAWHVLRHAEALVPAVQDQCPLVCTDVNHLLACVCGERGHFAAALPYAEAAARIASRAYGDAHPIAVRTHHELAMARFCVADRAEDWHAACDDMRRVGRALAASPAHVLRDAAADAEAQLAAEQRTAEAVGREDGEEARGQRRARVRRCSHVQCGKREQRAGTRFMTCSACLLAVYCCSACQAAAWPHHRAQCTRVARARAQQQQQQRESEK